MKKIIQNSVFVLCVLTFSFGCKEETNPYPIPDYNVGVSIYLDSFDSEFSIGRVKTFNSSRGSAGYMGVVVYRVSADEFLAYDMACPNDHYNGCMVAEYASMAYNPSNLYFQCNKGCKVKFNMLDGYPMETSTYKYALKKYQVTKLDNQLFHIHN